MELRVFSGDENIQESQLVISFRKKGESNLWNEVGHPVKNSVYRVGGSIRKDENVIDITKPVKTEELMEKR